MSLLNLKKFSRGLKNSPSPLATLEKKGYSFGRVLAEGSYCLVRLARKDKEKFAVKIIKHSKKSAEFMHKFLPRELKILGTLNHRNVIKVYNIYSFKTHTFIFMELIQRGDMLEFIRKRSRLNEEEARRYFRQLVSAIRYLHLKNICHRDLKCENIMITDDDQIKLIDFGFSRSCIDEATGKRVLSRTYCGSTAYAAPEILLGKPYNPMMYDVWSLGCILFIMVAGSMPFDDSNIKQMVKNQIDKKIKFPGMSKLLSCEVKDLILHMLEPDITKRATMEQIANDPWFRGLPNKATVNLQKLPLSKTTP